VAAGARIRAHFTLQNYTEHKANEATTVWDIRIEIEGQNRPALIAEWIGRRYYA
jgi:acyl dehydratase